MRYSDIKDDWKNISRCVSFRIIEEVVDYNQGIMFEEYTNNYEKSYLIKKYFLGDKTEDV